MSATRKGMVGRVYRWREAYWRVVIRWRGNNCPRNVLIERVVQPPHFSERWVAADPPEQIVRPFRGLRRP